MAESACRAMITATHAQLRAAMIPSANAAAISAFISDRYSADCAMIRPSGNPLSNDEWMSMMGSGMVTMQEMQLVNIDRVKVFACGKAAWVVTKEHQKFTFTPPGGEPMENDDLTTISYMLESDGAKWTIVGGHRGTGQPFES
jgi:hypothetical protein